MMNSRLSLFALALLLLSALILAGCGVNTPAQAEPAAPAQAGPAAPAQAEPTASGLAERPTITDILPNPPPMPTGAPVQPSPTPPRPPATALQIAGAGTPLAQADFEGPVDLHTWTVEDASDTLSSSSIWAIKGGRLEQISDGDGAPGMYATALLTGDQSWADYIVSIAAYTTGNDEMGVTARANQKGYYVFRLLPAAGSQPTRVLSRYDVQTKQFSTIATATGPGFEAGRWYTLSLRVQGDQLQAFVDGQPALEARDATFARGRVGVYGYAQGGLTFDNLTVQALSASGQ